MNQYSMALALVLLAAAALSAHAREIHVSPKGSEQPEGTAAEPYGSIELALRQAKPGDTVRVGAGIYVGRVIVPASGEEGKPIVIQGERDDQGKWLSIIDSSVPLDVKWVAAPEIGEGVYKTPFPGYEPMQMLVDGKFIPRVWKDHMADGSGFKAMALPPDHVTKDGLRYWDVMGAMMGNRDGWTYIRFRDRDDPNRKSLRAAPAGGGVHIEDRQYVILRNLMVRGGENCVQITGNKAAHNVIENCRLLNGAKRVYMSNGASQNLVRKNEMTIDFYADTCKTGAWGYDARGEAVPYEFILKRDFYRLYKMFFGPNSTSDYGVRMFRVGPGNEVCHNLVHRGGQGISLYDGQDVRIHHNTVYGFSSIGIITTLNRVRNAQVYENTVYDCNINMRIHHCNEPSQPFPRSLYVYHNRFWNHPRVGTHIYFHYMPKHVIPEGKHARIYIYQNTFAGGTRGLSVSGWAENLGALPETVAVNNILSTGVAMWANRTFIAKEDAWGVFDYNWCGGGFKTSHPGHDYRKAAWYGEHNIFKKGGKLWDAEEMPDFKPPLDEDVLTSGLDLSKPQEIRGRKFGPLPGVELGLAKRIGAY